MWSYLSTLATTVSRWQSRLRAGANRAKNFSRLNLNRMSSPSKAPGDQSDSASNQSNEKIASDKIIIPKAALKDAELVTAQGNIITKEGVVISTQDSDSNFSTNVFQDPEVKSYYIDLYEKSKYECRHVFDADLTWTLEEEKKLVRKLDVRGMCNSIFYISSDKYG